MTEKKIVRSESTPKKTEKKGATPSAASPKADVPDVDPNWKPTPEAKAESTKLRLIAAGLWVLAIAAEAFAIFWVLRQDSINMVLLVALIAVIAALAIGGSLLWKKANRLDPASKSDTVRFFVQNQLGAIITMIAFLPLIVLIFMNKDMDGKQKGIAGGIGIVALLVASYVGVSLDPPSTEQYAAEENKVIAITGVDEVFWTKAGNVFHLCEDVSAVNLESKDNKIYAGTVAQAHEAGKSRLTLQVEQEAKQCGFEVPADVPEEAPAE